MRAALHLLRFDEGGAAADRAHHLLVLLPGHAATAGSHGWPLCNTNAAASLHVCRAGQGTHLSHGDQIVTVV